MTSHPTSASDGPTDRRGLRVLGLEECLALAAGCDIGRVAFASDGEVTILPVSHLVDGSGVSFSTTWGSKLQVAADGSRMAFEVDHTDSETRTGWSVLMQGSATIVHDPVQTRLLDARRGAPWVPSTTRTFWVHLRPDSVSGREIQQPARGTS